MTDENKKKSSNDSSLYRGALSIMDVMARRSAEEVSLASAHRSTSPLLPPDMKQIFDELPKVRSRSKVNKGSSMEPPSSMEPRAIASRLSKATEAMWATLGTIAADMEESERKLGCNLEYVAESTSTVLSQLSSIIATSSRQDDRKGSSEKVEDSTSWNATAAVAPVENGKKKLSSLDSRPLKRPRKLEINTGKSSTVSVMPSFESPVPLDVTASFQEKTEFTAPLPRKNSNAAVSDLVNLPKLDRKNSAGSLNHWVANDTSFESMDMAWMDVNAHSNGAWAQHGTFRKASPGEEEPATPDIIDAINGTISAPSILKKDDTSEKMSGRGGESGSQSEEQSEDSDMDDDDDDDDDFAGEFGDSDDNSMDAVVEDNGLALAKKTRSLSVLCFSRALLFNPSNVPALISLGREAMRSRQWRLGAERLRRAIVTDSGVLNKGKSSKSSNKHPEAPLLRSDLGASSSNIIGSSVWRDLGMCLLKLNDLEGSSAAYASALTFYTPSDPITTSDHTNASRVPVEASRSPLTLLSSIQSLANTWDTDAFPDDAELWFGVGLLQARRGQVDLSSEALRASVLLDPTGTHICNARLKLAGLLKHSGNLDDATLALQNFQTALDNRICSCRITGVAGEKNSHKVLLGVPDIVWIDDKDLDDKSTETGGCCFHCKGKHTASYGWSDLEAGCTGELRRRLLIELGHVLESKGDWAGARTSYEAALVPSYTITVASKLDCSVPNAIASSPVTATPPSSSTSTAIAQCDSSPLLQQLGWLLHTRFDDLGAAIQMLVKATSLPQGAKDWRGWFLLGRLYMAQGDDQHTKYHKAYRAFETAVHIDPLNPKIWTSLGILFSRLHQYHDAVDAHGRALRIDPSQYHAWGNVAALYDFKGQPKDAIEAYDIGLTLMEQAGLMAKSDKTMVKENTEGASLETTAEVFRKRIAVIKGEMAAIQ